MNDKFIKEVLALVKPDYVEDAIRFATLKAKQGMSSIDISGFATISGEGAVIRIK